MGFADFFKNFKKDERALPKEAPSHWIKCPSCNALMYYKEVVAQHYTCPKCNFHMRIGSQDRIALMCDEGSFVEFAWLKPIISSAEDLSFVNERFSTLITKIERVTYEDLENQTLLTTNTGVVFVIDDNLGTDAFNSFYTYYINEKNVTNQDHGYIYYDPEEKSLKHKDSLI